MRDRALRLWAFAILLAVGFYFLRRRAWSELVLQRESGGIARRSRPFAARDCRSGKAAERNLAVAEQNALHNRETCGLGRDVRRSSAHELNQHAGAMKTYLGRRAALLQRGRSEICVVLRAHR